jgi:hypothetical protein
MIEQVGKCGTRAIRETIQIANDRSGRDTRRQKVICATINAYKTANYRRNRGNRVFGNWRAANKAYWLIIGDNWLI